MKIWGYKLYFCFSVSICSSDPTIHFFNKIPYATFIEMIRYKAERQGIQVIDREESYTSKSSFLNLDDKICGLK
ncbi:zinc ribbon domain-containing protein [Neobacillus sp. 19]|uniref:zinc ribbon domain-containing protein n=1 Tax=Neobacillus sp. 19 TaxID=3394458 RepID=UPI003BF6DCC3